MGSDVKYLRQISSFLLFPYIMFNFSEQNITKSKTYIMLIYFSPNFILLSGEFNLVIKYITSIRSQSNYDEFIKRYLHVNKL